MLYGTTVTVTPEGIRIPEERLKPLGIYHDSLCWGVEVSDRHLLGEANAAHDALPHLVIAPFDLAAWPAMFRVELKLQLERLDAMAQAAAVMDEVAFNILSIQKTPSGHHHTTVIAMGECEELKVGNPVVDRHPLPPTDAAGVKRMRDYIDGQFAPMMLAYSQLVSERISKRHRDPLVLASRAGAGRVGTPGRGILRETFTGEIPGVLYDASRLPLEFTPWDEAPDLIRALASLKESIRHVGLLQSTQAVRCTWLQNLAFFWLYRSSDEALTLRYDAAAGLLRPIGDDSLRRVQRVMQSGMPAPQEEGGSIYPFKTIATLDQHEHYLRIVRSRHDAPGRTAFANLQYSARLSNVKATTRGLQRRVYEKLASHQPYPFAVRRVSSGLRTRSNSLEDGWFHFLVSRSGTEKAMDAEQLAQVEGILREQLAKTSSRVDDVEHSVSVEHFGARRLFLSTSFDWYDRNPKVAECIDNLARRYGFRLRLGRSVRMEAERQLEQLRTPSGLTRMVSDQIERCQAFLLLLPEEVQTQGGAGQWEFFELGCAAGKHIPRRICVQTDHVDVAQWSGIQAPHFDQELIEFRIADEMDSLMASIEPAFISLAGPDRGAVETR